MSRIFLVTGAAGHLGTSVVRELTKRGERVRALVLPDDSAPGLAGLPVEMVEGDVACPPSLDLLFRGLDADEVIFIHLAGIVTISNAYVQRIYDINVSGTANVVAKCKQHKVKRLVYASSVHAIPEAPDNQVIREVDSFDPEKVEGFYAKTKAEASEIVMQAGRDGMDVVVVHPSGICGPGDFGRGHITQLILDFLDHRLPSAVHGAYDFVDVRDVAYGIVQAALKGRSGEGYLLSNKQFTIENILDIAAKLTGRKPIRSFLPIWFAKMTAPLAELWYKLLKQPPLFTRYSLYTLQSNSNFTHAKATRELDYKTRPMTETIRDTILFLKKHNRFKKNVTLVKA